MMNHKVSSVSMFLDFWLYYLLTTVVTIFVLFCHNCIFIVFIKCLHRVWESSLRPVKFHWRTFLLFTLYRYLYSCILVSPWGVHSHQNIYTWIFSWMMNRYTVVVFWPTQQCIIILYYNIAYTLIRCIRIYSGWCI